MNNTKPNNRSEKGMGKDIPDIFIAAENNDLSALDIALQHCDVNDRDANGLTPLHYAASTLSGDAIDRLLAEPNIDATLADNFGRSAASLAFECWRNLSAETVDKLRSHCYPWLFEDAPEI